MLHFLLFFVIMIVSGKGGILMNSYNLPRNVKGEGRILFIFSTKALIYTFIGMLIGTVFYIIFSMLKMKTVGVVFIVVFGLIGFIIATFKIPDTTAFEFTKKTGGENIDDVIKRYVRFKMQKGKIYVYDKDKTEEKYKAKEEGGK